MRKAHFLYILQEYNKTMGRRGVNTTSFLEINLYGIGTMIRFNCLAPTDKLQTRIHTNKELNGRYGEANRYLCLNAASSY